MKELLEEPLDGAPYGYTPFCDSRTDMDGFRYNICIMMDISSMRKQVTVVLH